MWVAQRRRVEARPSATDLATPRATQAASDPREPAAHGDEQRIAAALGQQRFRESGAGFVVEHSFGDGCAEDGPTFQRLVDGAISSHAARGWLRSPARDGPPHAG